MHITHPHPKLLTKMDILDVVSLQPDCLRWVKSDTCGTNIFYFGINLRLDYHFASNRGNGRCKHGKISEVSACEYLGFFGAQTPNTQVLKLAGRVPENSQNRNNSRYRNPDCGWLYGVVFTTDATRLDPLAFCTCDLTPTFLRHTPPAYIHISYLQARK